MTIFIEPKSFLRHQGPSDDGDRCYVSKLTKSTVECLLTDGRRQVSDKQGARRGLVNEIIQLMV
jgi:hypothetical protein